MSNSPCGSDFIESAKSVRTSKEFSDLRVSSSDGKFSEIFSGHQFVCLPYVRDILSKHGKVPAFIVLPVPKHYLKKILEFVHQGGACPALSSKEEGEEFLVHAKKMGLRNIVVTIASTTNKTMVKSSKSSNNIVNNSLNPQPRNVCIIRNNPRSAHRSAHRSAPHSSPRYQPYMPTAALSRSEKPCNVSVSIPFSSFFFLHNLNLFHLIRFRYMLCYLFSAYYDFYVIYVAQTMISNVIFHCRL